MNFRFTLSHTSGTEVLTHDPEGWHDVVLSIERDLDMHGMFQNFDTNLSFFYKGGGRQFIETIYDADGIDEEIDLLVEVDCGESGIFEVLYNGRLDFSDMVQDKTFLAIDIKQDDISQLVINRKDTKIDLNAATTMEGTAIAAMNFGPYDLTLHSKTIFAESELDDDLSDLHTFSITTAEAVKRLWCQVPYEMIVNELKETQTPAKYTNKDTSASTHNDQTNVSFHNSGSQSPLLLPGTYDVDFDFSGTYRDNVPDAVNRIVGGIGGAGIDLALFYGDRSDLNVFVIGNIAGYTTAAATHNIAFNFNGSTTLNLVPGDELWLIWVIHGYDITTGSGSHDVNITFDHSGGGDTANLKISIDSVVDSSTAKAWAIHEAFAKISQSITDQTDAFRSDYFGRLNSQPHSYAANGCGAFTAVTNGYQIRKFALSEHTVYMSLKDLFDAQNAIWNLGMGIEEGGSGQVIRVEPKNYFYDNTVVLQIPNISDLKTTVAADRFTSLIEIGYSRWQLEDINLLDEFCTKQQCTTFKKATENEINAICEFIASGYVIEFTRRNRFGTTADWRYDSDSFVICLNRSVDGGDIPTLLTVAEKNENLASSTGLLEPSTIYNVRISPKRNLFRWSYMLGPSLLKKPLGTIGFTAGEANHNIVLDFIDNNCPGEFSGFPIGEDQDFSWDSGNLEDGVPVWKPIYHEFDQKLSYTDYKLIQANPRQTIEISETNGNFIKCFILEVGYKPVRGTASFRLIESNN